MATASTLQEAAGQSFENLFLLWIGGDDGLKDALAAFAAAVLPIFPDQDPTGRPLSDWATVIFALSARIPSVSLLEKTPYENLVFASDYVYRICWLGARPTPESPAISAGQQALLLAAYNAAF